MRRPLLLLVASLASACSSAEAPPGPAASTAPSAAPAQGRLFVTNESGGDISVVDVGAQKVVATIPVGKRPRGIRVSPDGTQLYVALSGSPLAPPGVDEKTLPPADKKADGIGVVSIADLKLVKVMPAGSDPEQIAVTADGQRLFLTTNKAHEERLVRPDNARFRVACSRCRLTGPLACDVNRLSLRPDRIIQRIRSQLRLRIKCFDCRHSVF